MGFTASVPINRSQQEVWDYHPADSLDAECRTKGFLWGLLRPLISFAMARADRVQPSRLKGALERSLGSSRGESR